jgi:signal transduction histidine kinase
MRPQIEKNNILVQITLPEDLWVRADEDQLQQVFLNLLMNAIQAIEADGRILIAAAEGMRDRVAYWDIQVHDTGPGISHEELSLVFEPFYTSKKEFGGTGLGLSVVKEILKKHDGEISVETKLGEGSTFHVLLPK